MATLIDKKMPVILTKINTPITMQMEEWAIKNQSKKEVIFDTILVSGLTQYRFIHASLDNGKIIEKSLKYIALSEDQLHEWNSEILNSEINLNIYLTQYEINSLC